METQCIQEQLAFQQLGRREVIGRFGWWADQFGRRRVAIAGGGDGVWDFAASGGMFS